jgi:hypothetical protein
MAQEVWRQRDEDCRMYIDTKKLKNQRDYIMEQKAHKDGDRRNKEETARKLKQSLERKRGRTARMNGGEQKRSRIQHQHQRKKWKIIKKEMASIS